VHHGAVGEHERWAERNARTYIDAAEQGRHVVADGIKTLDRCAGFIEHARVAVG